jgi:hypothetical protein
MKRRRILFGSLAVTILAVAVAVWDGARHADAALSLRIHTITNDAAGPVVVLSATRHRTAAVHPDSFAQKVGDTWAWYPIPTNQMAEVEALTTKGAQPALATVHFPANSPWRLRLEVIEPQTGLAGLMERLRYPTGFYRKGGVLNVLCGTKPSRYTGRAYYVESEEIR